MGDWASSVAEKGDKIAKIVQRSNRIGRIENIGTKLRNGRTRIPLVAISHLPGTSLCSKRDSVKMTTTPHFVETRPHLVGDVRAASKLRTEGISCGKSNGLKRVRTSLGRS